MNMTWHDVSINAIFSVLVIMSLQADLVNIHIRVMLRADKPSCGNEIRYSWRIAVFTAQALLGLNLFECLPSGLE